MMDGAAPAASGVCLKRWPATAPIAKLAPHRERAFPRRRRGGLMLALKEIRDAHTRIRDKIHRTPVLTSATLDAQCGGSLFFKCENFQKIGAFKARGATNAIFLLSDEEAKPGVVTHSSGNHAAAVARAAKLRGIPAYIVMPHNVPRAKQD